MPYFSRLSASATVNSPLRRRPRGKCLKSLKRLSDSEAHSALVLVSLTFAGKYHQAVAECKINFLTMLINIFIEQGLSHPEGHFAVRCTKSLKIVELCQILYRKTAQERARS